LIKNARDNIDKASALMQAFSTMFLFFLISAGSVLIILGIMYWFSKNRKSCGDMASVFIRILAGVGLALVSTSSFSAFEFESITPISKVYLSVFSMIGITYISITRAVKSCPCVLPGFFVNYYLVSIPAHCPKLEMPALEPLASWQLPEMDPSQSGN
jgi:hypothetical protein